MKHPLNDTNKPLRRPVESASRSSHSTNTLLSIDESEDEQPLPIPRRKPANALGRYTVRGSALLGWHVMEFPR
jgi:hypothetical protein